MEIIAPLSMSCILMASLLLATTTYMYPNDPVRPFVLFFYICGSAGWLSYATYRGNRFLMVSSGANTVMYLLSLANICCLKKRLDRIQAEHERQSRVQT